MGSCVSKKATRAGAGAKGKGKVAAPLPVMEKEKEGGNAQLPPVLEAEVEEEEVKEVVLSETPAPRPPRPPEPEPVKRRREQQPEADDETAAAASETCSASDSAASVTSSSAAMEKAKLYKAVGGDREPELEKRAVDAPDKAKSTPRRTAAPEEIRESRKPKGSGGTGHGRARSPSPSSAHRRQQQQSGGQQGQQHHPPAPRPRREQPAVVSGIGCRSGRFSPSAARRAAESAAAVRRSHSAREADMALPSSSKRSLLCLNNAAISGNVAGHGGGSALSRRDPGERSGRRSESPTGSRRAAASPSPSTSAIHCPGASPMRKPAAKEHGHGTPERARPPAPRVVRDDGGDERPAALSGGVGGEQKKLLADGEEGTPLGQNPSVAMECFIFL